MENRIQDGLFSIRRNLNMEDVHRGYHHGLREMRARALKYPVARRKHTCLKYYACCLCVPWRTSKLAKKPAGTQEERLKLTVTDVGNIYNVPTGGKHCCEVPLNFVFKSITIHSSTSVHIHKHPTQLTFSNSCRIIGPVP